MKSERVEATSPRSATTCSLAMRRVAGVAASSGLPSSSRAMSCCCRPLMPPAALASLVASWMPRSLEVPKVASLPVIDPTSPILVAPFPAPVGPPPCSFLQATAASNRQNTNFAGMRPMGGSVPKEKAALLTTPLRGDQPACRRNSPIVGSTRARAYPRRRRQPRAAHAAFLGIRGGGVPGVDRRSRPHRPGHRAQGAARPRHRRRSLARPDGLRRGGGAEEGGHPLHLHVGGAQGREGERQRDGQVRRPGLFRKAL